MAGEHIGQLEMGFGETVLEGDCLCIMRGGLVQAAKRLVGGGDIVVAFGNSAVQGDRFADQIDRGIVAAQLVGENAKKLQAHDVIWIGAQDAPI